MPAVAIWTQAMGKRNHFPIACNSYDWFTFYTRAGKKWGVDLEENIAELAKTGIKGYEPSIETATAAQKLLPVLKKHDIAMPSIYVGSILHDEALVQQSISTTMAIAKVVKDYGTKIVVTNPNPIKWGTNELKTDAQLAIQAEAMENLGSQLRQIGLTLAYHTHDIELKAGAREFHHILQNTTAKNVSFCFDVHWVYRGSENSGAAVFDVLKLYGQRIVELHLRQSVAGIWSETFTAKGDIDYNRFANELTKMNIKPHLVIEQCLEDRSPNTIDVVTAHIKDLAAIKETFF